MRLDALRESVRKDGAEPRAALIDGVTGEQAERLYGALVAVLLVDTSMRVRSAVEAALRRRSPADVAARPSPPATLAERERAGIVRDLVLDRTLVEVLLAASRGRDLLAGLPPAEVPIEDVLIDLCRDADAPVVRDALLLPLDVRGRAASLISAFRTMKAESRDVVLGALVWGTLAETFTPAEREVNRAKAAVSLWVQGLLESPRDVELPTFATFIEAGGALQRGLVGAALIDYPSPASIAALKDLSRCITLALGPQVLLEAAPLRDAARSSLAELRAVAWRLLIAGEHATPVEVLDAAAAEACPGVTVELVRALPSPLSPEVGARLLGLRGHRNASVRAAVTSVLGREPLLAALCAAALDPRAQDTPLEVLVAQPPALRGASLIAWLEVERPPEPASQALEALDRPPPPEWPAWGRLLAHPAPVVRRAARRALLRLPLQDGARLAGAPLLGRVLEDDAATFAALVLRFSLPAQHGALARVLLDEHVGDVTADAAVRALASHARGGTDQVAQAILWAFVIGRGHVGATPTRRMRFGSRRARRLALDELLALPEPGPGGAADPRLPDEVLAAFGVRREDTHEKAARFTFDVRPLRSVGSFAALLLADRDPAQVELGLRVLEARPGAADLRGPTRLPGTELRARLSLLLDEALSRVARARSSRAWRATLTRLMRSLLPRAWFTPGGAVRGVAALAGLLPLLLERAVALAQHAGAREALPWADDVLPLLSHGDAKVRVAVARALPALPGAPPIGLLLSAGGDVALAALRAAHPAQAEAALQARLVGTGPLDQETLAWIESAPRAAYVPPLARRLDAQAARASARRALLVIGGADSVVPGGRAAVRTVVTDVVRRALASRYDAELRAAISVARELGALDLAAPLLEGLRFAGDAARVELVALVREAQASGVVLGHQALAPLLEHPLAEVRVLGVSLLRNLAGEASATEAARAPERSSPWAAVRASGPCPGRPLPVDLAKPLLGVCEDHWEEAMGLAVEALLEHPDGEVARRALKLLNRRGREVSTLPLLLGLGDPEARQPLLTTFSTWSARFLEPGLPAGLSATARAESLEAARRELRTTLELLATGPRARVAPALQAALGSPIPYVRAAALVGIGRLALRSEQAAVATALADPDPVVARAAAWAAGGLPRDASDDGLLDAGLRKLARSREAEVRATARRALIARLPVEAKDELEGHLTDGHAEVRLHVLAGALERPELVAALGLEARLGDDDPRVRELALRGLARRTTGRRPPHVLAGPLADARPEVRLAALEVAQRWACAAELPGELALALADPSIHVSGLALDVLEASVPAGVEPEELLEPAAEVAPPADAVAPSSAVPATTSLPGVASGAAPAGVAPRSSASAAFVAAAGAAVDTPRSGASAAFAAMVGGAAAAAPAAAEAEPELGGDYGDPEDELELIDSDEADAIGYGYGEGPDGEDGDQDGTDVEATDDDDDDGDDGDDDGDDGDEEDR